MYKVSPVLINLHGLPENLFILNLLCLFLILDKTQCSKHTCIECGILNLAKTDSMKIPPKSHKVQVYNYKFSQRIKENVISLFVLVKASCRSVKDKSCWCIYTCPSQRITKWICISYHVFLKKFFFMQKQQKLLIWIFNTCLCKKSRVNVHIYSRVGPYAKTTRVSNACPHKDSE